MKNSKTPTAHILVRAFTNSEWDNCGFALVCIDEEWKDTVLTRMGYIAPFVNELYLCSHVYWDAPMGFYADHIADELLDSNENWAYVTLEEGEPEQFFLPENKLDTFQFAISKNMGGTYKAYGKYTSEEFWTAEFNLAELVNADLNV
ncbi:MAG: hypothetical protein J0I32_19970 [Sphingobacteriales bacterium]|nr:hypothetical protein [Sphingobacteriales bacterium]OJV98788.1 MAG: hypothetical protein BGO52_08425 [Sphingobacteriales bacterium 44-61]